MLVLFKALAVLMVFATLVFVLTKPLFCRFMSPRDYAIRRNLWLALTLTAFLAPSYWSYVLVAGVLVLFAAQRDSNPVALYMFLLITLPPLGMELPTFGIVNQLFALNHLRFLSLLLLLPIALGYFRRKPVPWESVPDGGRAPSLVVTDWLLLAYVALQVLLSMPYESFTASGKRLVLIGLETVLPYYVLSRALRTRESFREALAAFVLAALVLVPLGVFETFKGWLLFAGLEDHWGTVKFLGFLRRGAYLRAQVNAGHSIVLGFTFAVALGFWFSLQASVDSLKWRWAVLLSLLVGLLVTFSRGPWVGAVLIWVIFLRLGPDSRRRSAKAIGLLFVVGIAVFLSPLGDTIKDNIPFIGSVGDETVEYRKRLAETSWLLVLQNPVFGSRNFLAYMEDLRQGEGIIDIVNAYATIALSYGLVGLGLFCSFFGVVIVRCFKALRHASGDPEFSLVGAALVAILVAALAMLFTVNLYMSIGVLTWVLAGMGVAYARLAQPEFAGRASDRQPLDTGLERRSLRPGARGLA